MVALVATLLVGYRFGSLWSLPVLAVLGGLVFVFRERRRQVPAQPFAVVSPVDGTVVSVQAVRDPWLERESLRIRLRLPRPGITPLRSPVEGKVMDYWTKAGSWAAKEPDSEDRSPGVYTIWIQTDEGDDIVFSIACATSLSRHKCDVPPGQRVGQGKRNGFIYFGHRVDVFLPPNARSMLREDAPVLAGSGVLATLVRNPG